MDCTTWLKAEPQCPELDHLPIQSLYTAFQSLADPRKARGKRYELALILTLLVLAKLTGETPLSGATHWLRLRAAFKEQLRLSRAALPCQNTYRMVLGGWMLNK